MIDGSGGLSKSLSVIKEFENRIMRNGKSAQREASTSENRKQEQSRPGL